MTKPIIQYIQEQLEKQKNPKNAQAMAAYMKTTEPFYGIKAPDRRAIAKIAYKQYPIQSQQEYLEIIKILWAQPYREEKYIAIDTARAYPHYINLAAIPYFEQMIREGAWWDFVDEIAVNLIGTVLAKHPSAMWPTLDNWINDSDMWIRRTAIICQNKFKNKTDQQRLFAFCLSQAHEKEFFIRKAIGWALREYGKTEPQQVVDFMTQHKARFSGLSYKEAIRRIIATES